MELKRFAIEATHTGRVDIVREPTGWSMRFKTKGKCFSCMNRHKERRTWKSIDTLIKQLRKAGYRGELIVPISAEQLLFEGAQNAPH